MRIPILQDQERRRTALRVIGLVVGLVFFAAAIHFAMGEQAEFAKALEALRDPPPSAVALVLASVAIGAVLSALLFHILMRRFGTVPFWEMQALIAASAFANYLPLKPGFVGRVAYHRVRHGIRAAHTLRTILEAIAKYAPQYTPAQLADRAWLAGELARLGEAVHPDDGLGGMQLSLFDATVETQLFDPTFIIDYPTEVSPLARRNDADPSITERFELFIAGREIANGFSELNDPDEQASVFRQQASRKDSGDAEAMHYDADYVRALEYGLPPCGGEGIGIDRLVMLLTDSSTIRGVILFPQMRRED